MVCTTYLEGVWVLELKRLGHVHKPIHKGQLGSLFLSFINNRGSPSRELVAVTTGRPGKNSHWQVRVHEKPFEIRFCRPCRSVREIRKIELRTPTIPLEQIMLEVMSFYGSGRRLIGGQLDLDGRRECWINPELLEDEDFKGLVQTREMLNNGCDEKQKRFYQKLARLYSFDLGVSPEKPEQIFEEIENFKKGFSVWI